MVFFKKKITVDQLANELDIHLDASKNMALAEFEMMYEDWDKLIAEREEKIEEDIWFLCGFAIVFAIFAAIRNEQKNLEVIQAFGFESGKTLSLSESDRPSPFTLNVGKTVEYNKQLELSFMDDTFHKKFGTFLVEDIFGEEYNDNLELVELMAGVFEKTLNTVKDKIRTYKIV